MNAAGAQSHVRLTASSTVRQLRATVITSHPAMPPTTVLSFSNDPEHLLEREVAIRNGGFAVVSVSSEGAARFEIEMGRCGVLLICYTIPPLVSSELASFFRRSCPGGLIITVLNEQPATDADTWVSGLVSVDFGQWCV